ncbi:MAG: hypothetical protein M3O28_05610 [Actinomycetota bacterium]|nr:hypothetical protein [Actinomycetota bacterium]
MSLRSRAVLMSTVRAAIGIASIAAPTQAARVAGYPANHDNPTARLMSGLFGVRELLLAWLVIDAAATRDGLTAGVFALQSAVDAADVVVQSMPVFKREGIDRAALGGIAVAAVASVMWARLARSARRTASTGAMACTR